MFGPIKKSIQGIREVLHEVLETPINHQINARLGQQLRIEDKVLDRAGPITIIQNQQVNANTIINISKALRFVEQLEEAIKIGAVKYGQDEILESLMIDGVSWEDLKKRMKRKYFMKAYEKANKDSKEAARILGVGRSTVTTFLLENKINEPEK